jgi:hypothetical protein
MGFLGLFKRPSPPDVSERLGQPYDDKRYIAACQNGTLPGLPHDDRYWLTRIDAYRDEPVSRLVWDRAGTEQEATEALAQFARECGSKPRRVTEKNLGRIDGRWEVTTPSVQSSLRILHPVLLELDRVEDALGEDFEIDEAVDFLRMEREQHQQQALDPDRI